VRERLLGLRPVISANDKIESACEFLIAVDPAQKRADRLITLSNFRRALVTYLASE
jgi:hypothetical protein